MRRLPPALLALAFATLIAGPLAHAAADGVVATAPEPKGPSAAPQDPEARYQQLLADAKARAPYADWKGLRVAFAERPGFKATGQDAMKGAMFKALEAADCGKALAEAKAVIDKAYVDADAHLVAAFCEQKAGDAVGATRERDIGVGLLQSIVTGDGLSPQAAFQVIDVDEEYELFRAKGLKVTAQALMQRGGHAYDAVTAINDKGASTTYYFLVDRVLAAESGALKPGEVSEGGPPDRN